MGVGFLKSGKITRRELLGGITAVAGSAEGDFLVRIADIGLRFVIEADQLGDVGQVILCDRLACIGMNGHGFSPAKLECVGLKNILISRADISTQCFPLIIILGQFNSGRSDRAC